MLTGYGPLYLCYIFQYCLSILNSRKLRAHNELPQDIAYSKASEDSDSLRILAVWSETSLIAYAFYSRKAEAFPGVWGTREQAHLFSGNKETLVLIVLENKGTKLVLGKREKEILEITFKEQRNRTDYV